MPKVKAANTVMVGKFAVSCFPNSFVSNRLGFSQSTAWLRVSTVVTPHRMPSVHKTDAMEARQPHQSFRARFCRPADLNAGFSLRKFSTNASAGLHINGGLAAHDQRRGEIGGHNCSGSRYYSRDRGDGNGEGEVSVKPPSVKTAERSDIAELERQLKELDDLHHIYNRKRAPVYDAEREELVNLNFGGRELRSEDISRQEEFSIEPDRSDVEIAWRFNHMVKGASKMGLQRQKPFPAKFPSQRSSVPVPRPKRIILIRHGESQGNRNERIYTETPDWRIPLSEDGLLQAQFAGKEVKTILGNESVYLYHSPYNRTVQTCQQIMLALDPLQVRGIREEPRIAEQQFGNLQDLASLRRSKIERRKYGRFFYRFPNGEAGLDVYSRISSFIGTIRRDHLEEECNVVIVTHGLALRLFLMRWFQWTVEQFEATHNPPNCGLAVMTRIPDDGRYALSPETLQMIGADKAPTTSSIGRSMLRKAYVDAFLTY